MNLRNTLTLVATLALACDSATTESPNEARQAQAPVHLAGQVDEPGSSSASTTAFEIDGDWRTSVEQAVTQLRQDDPQRATSLYDLGPRSTRAQTLRFSGPLVRDPIAAAVFLDRLAQGQETPEVRAALVEALPRTTGPFGPALVDLFDTESEEAVRLQMVAVMRTADAASARTVLELGFGDTAAAVRAESAKTVARRRDGASFEAPLMVAAADADTGVKGQAMRALGALGVEGAKSLLEDELDAISPELRLEAVRALTRIDPAYAAGLSSIRALVSDGDERVAKAAAKATQTAIANE